MRSILRRQCTDCSVRVLPRLAADPLRRIAESIRRSELTKGEPVRYRTQRASGVAIVSTTIPRTVNDFHRELIRRLLTHREVCVVSSSGHELDELAEDLPVRTEIIEMARDIAIVHDFRALALWIKLLRRERPELVLTATPKAGLLGQIAARLTGVQCRVYFLGGLRLEGATGWHRSLLVAMEFLTCAASTRVVANSPSLASRALELRLTPRRKIGMTDPGSSHGVDVEHFSPVVRNTALGAELGLDATLPVIGFVGRLTKDKGIHTLIEAMGHLGSRRMAVQLLVIGHQDEVDSSTYVRRLHELPATTVVVGAVDDVRPYFGLMDIHALPSLREGFPNVVLEASAMAVPTVTTNATGAVDSVINGVTGLICPIEDGFSLANALQQLIEDVALRRQLGDEARRWVGANFDPHTVVESLLCAAHI